MIRVFSPFARAERICPKGRSGFLSMNSLITQLILRSVDMLEAGDGFLIMGKGHETGQIIGDDILPFDDVEQASVAVGALDGLI